jgi:hypothetical protein
MGGAGDEHIGKDQGAGAGDWDEDWNESEGGYTGGAGGADPFEEDLARSDQEEEEEEE